MRSRRHAWTVIVATMLPDVLLSARMAAARTPAPAAVTCLSVAEPFTLMAAGIGLALVALMRRPPRN